MAKLARITQPIFAGNAPQEDTAVFGTMKTTPVYTRDVATSIDTAAFSNGWKDAVEVGYAPFLEEMNTVQKAFSYQVAYNQQQGISEWGDDVEYNIGSLVKINTANGSQIYSSLADNNVGNLVSDNTKWKLVLDSTVDYATVAQLNTKANNNAVVHTTGVETILGMKYFSQPVVFNYASEGGEAYWIPQNTVKAAQVVTDVIDTGSDTLQWRIFSYGGSLGIRIFRFDFDNQVLILPTNPALNSNNTTAATTAWVKSITTGHIQRGQIGTQGAIRTITFSSPFANTNYSVIAMCRGNEADDAYSFISENIPNRTTSSCRIYAYGSAAQSRGFDWIAIGD